MPLESPIKIELKDLDHVALELKGPPIYSRIAVFIRDPEDRRRYWFRKFQVQPGIVIDKDRSALEYVEIKQYDLGDYNLIPCSEKALPIAVNNMIASEASLSQVDDPVVREMRAVVGVARYDGPKKLSLDTITTLVGIKYQQMKPTNQN